MRWFLNALPIPLGSADEDGAYLLAKSLGKSPSDFENPRLERLSVDARRKSAIRHLAAFSFEGPSHLTLSLPPGCTMEAAQEPYDFEVQELKHPIQVLIVGSGPAGLFCALRLLDYGIRPLLIERGKAMDERVRSVDALWRGGPLDPQANAQFGEGGAGTFSDGKLATRIRHSGIRYVLEKLVRFGADPRILWEAKPHVGTDLIRRCVVRIRKHMEEHGAQIRFQARLMDLVLRQGQVTGAILEGGETLPCDALVLAPGHSARDTFEMLHRRSVAMQSKAFAMGVRIEHPQELIDRAQYGGFAGHRALGASDYRLVCNLGPDRAVYSFCMCPGGIVIQCASSEGESVANGMSYSQRDSGWANSGLVAKVNPEDFGSNDVLAGMVFQQTWERKAFALAKLALPAMTTQAFLTGRPKRLHSSSAQPSLVEADLRKCLPPIVQEQLLAALPQLEQKIRGFTGQESLLIGLESRTSSPVQMPRREDGQSISHPQLYPCGEGTGHAGGITSAAVDGLRVAAWIARRCGAEINENIGF